MAGVAGSDSTIMEIGDETITIIKGDGIEAMRPYTTTEEERELDPTVDMMRKVCFEDALIESINKLASGETECTVETVGETATQLIKLGGALQRVQAGQWGDIDGLYRTFTAGDENVVPQLMAALNWAMAPACDVIDEESSDKEAAVALRSHYRKLVKGLGLCLWALSRVPDETESYKTFSESQVHLLAISTQQQLLDLAIEAQQAHEEASKTGEGEGEAAGLAEGARELLATMRPLVHVCFNMAKGKKEAAEMADAGVDDVAEGFIGAFRSMIHTEEMLSGAFASLCELSLRTRRDETEEDNGGMAPADAVSQRLRTWGALDVAQASFYSSLRMLQSADESDGTRVAAAASAAGAGAEGADGKVDESEEFRKVRIFGDSMHVMSICTGFADSEHTVLAETAVFEDSGLLDMVVEQLENPEAEPGVIMGTSEFCTRWLQWGDDETKSRRRDDFLDKYAIIEKMRPQIKRLSRRPQAAGGVVRVVLEILTGTLSPPLIARCEKASAQGGIELAADVLADESLSFAEPSTAGDAILLLSYCTADMPEADDKGEGTGDERRSKALEVAGEHVAKVIRHHAAEKRATYPFAMFSAKMTLGPDENVLPRRDKMVELGFLELGIELMRASGNDWQALNNAIAGIQRILERLNLPKEADEAILDRLEAAGFIEALGTTARDLGKDEEEHDGENEQGENGQGENKPKAKFSERIWQRVGHSASIMLLGGGPKLSRRIDAACKAGWVQILSRCLHKVIQGTSEEREGGKDNDVRAVYALAQGLAFMSVFTPDARGPAADALVACKADETVADLLECEREEFFTDHIVMGSICTLVSRISSIFCKEDSEAFVNGRLLRALPKLSQLFVELLADAEAATGEFRDAVDRWVKSGGPESAPDDQPKPDDGIIESLQLRNSLKQKLIPMACQLQGKAISNSLEGGGEELDRRVQTIMSIEQLVPSLIRVANKLDHQFDMGGGGMGAALQALGFLMIGPDPARMKEQCARVSDLGAMDLCVRALNTYPPDKDAAYFYGATMVQRFLVSESEEASEGLRVKLAEMGGGTAMARAMLRASRYLDAEGQEQEQKEAEAADAMQKGEVAEPKDNKAAAAAGEAAKGGNKAATASASFKEPRPVELIVQGATIEALLRQSAATLLGDTSDPKVMVRIQQLIDGGMPEAAGKLLQCPQIVSDDRLSYLLVTLLNFASNIDDAEAEDDEAAEESDKIRARNAITRAPGVEHLGRVIATMGDRIPEVADRGMTVLCRALLGSSNAPSEAAGRQLLAGSHKAAIKMAVESPHGAIRSLSLQYLAFLCIGGHHDVTEARSMLLVRDGALDAALAVLMGGGQDGGDDGMPPPELSFKVVSLMQRLLLANPSSSAARREAARHRAMHARGLVEALGKVLVEQFETSPVLPPEGQSVAEATEAFGKLAQEAAEAGKDPLEMELPEGMWAPYAADGGRIGGLGADVVRGLRGVQFAHETGQFQALGTDEQEFGAIPDDLVLGVLDEGGDPVGQRWGDEGQGEGEGEGAGADSGPAVPPAPQAAEPAAGEEEEEGGAAQQQGQGQGEQPAQPEASQDESQAQGEQEEGAAGEEEEDDDDQV